jgi:Methyltransferase domain
MNYSMVLTPYEAVADEYYDDESHPTCRNFGELSSKFLYPRIRQLAHSSKRALEVGAGESILADVFDRERLPLSRVTIFDQSRGMLQHSKQWIGKGAVAMIRDARRTGLQKGTYDLAVASLGDPYNCKEFWGELRRVMSDGGSALFTTPSYEWSSAFRSNEERDEAEFVEPMGDSGMRSRNGPGAKR